MKQHKNTILHTNMAKINIEEALNAYRVLHVPSNLSWKQHLVNEKYSDDNIMSCEMNERLKYMSHLRDSNVTILNNIKNTSGYKSDLSEIINLITDESRASISKNQRQALFSTNDGTRPVSHTAFDIWNGLQIIDMDIKNAELAVRLKYIIFEKLKKYNWFFGVALSNSMNGLHIYTKIQIQENEDKRKLLYYVNYRHKYSFVYLAVKSAMNELNFTLEDIVKWMDMSMQRPQQGVYISVDRDALFNSHFFEEFIYVDFDNVETIDDHDVDWVTYPDLKEIFKRQKYFEEGTGEMNDVEIMDANAPEFDTHNRFHYKHNERWRLANTLTKLYGLQRACNYMRMICTDDVSTKELQGICRTASQHDKSIDLWAVTRLNKYHGFNIKINKPVETSNDIYENTIDIENPLIIGNHANKIEFHIKRDEYLGTIKHQLLKNIGRITLIEAGAGLGKTEMIKSLVREGKKVMMVMPFTSTIKSKVEQDTDWKFSYGNKKPDLLARGLALTVDKFSKLNPMDISDAGFDYIFIDESHLLFMSKYRPVMAHVIELIKTLELPVIFTTGTPVAETIFFPQLTYIKVIKEDSRVKDFRVIINATEKDVLFTMCRAMANDIRNGKKILFPTNSGTLFATRVETMVNYFLENDGIECVVNYYKKANYGDDFMDDVNIRATLNKTDILMCSSFLSVGVDILDRREFNIYLNSLWMPQEIEQFANRLRNNDLHIKMYLAEMNAQGESNCLMSFHNYNPQLDDDELKNCHSILRICNSMIERNPTEYKYNSLVTSILSQNQYIEFNEEDNKYYFNDIAYKVTYFEEKYRRYVQQLIVVYNAMKVYGYNAYPIDTSMMSYDTTQEEEFKYVMSAVHDNVECTKTMLTQVTEELLDKITEDRLQIYRNVMDGMYEIKKGNDWKENEKTMTMTVKNAEVFEKVVPIFVSMSKTYSVATIKKMFEFCRDKHERYNFAELKRLRRLITILYNAKRDRLDIPINDFMHDVYNLCESSSKLTKLELNQFLIEHAKTYALNDSVGQLQILLSPLTMKTIEEHLSDIFDCLIEKSSKKEYVTLKRKSILWKTKQEEEQDFIDNLAFSIEDFFNDLTTIENENDVEL